MAITQFDQEFYFSQRPDVQAAIQNGGFNGTAEDHYNRFGWRELADPNPEFDTSYYLTTNPDVLAAKVNPFQHFVAYGNTEGRSGSGPAPAPTAQDQFDSYFYLNQRLDVLLAITNDRFDGSGEDHYDALGWRELADPNTQFSTFYYLAANPDVLAARINPFEHYRAHGVDEGRSGSGPAPAPAAQDQFDSYFYFTQRPDVLRAIANGDWEGSAEDHYNSAGWQERSDPNIHFDTSYYLENNPDVAEAGVNPFQHFVTFGIEEGRSGNDGGGSGGPLIAIDGSLDDWGTAAPLVAGSPTPEGYAVYGTYQDGSFIIGLETPEEPTPVEIGENTTLWFNTDGDNATGYQIFGWAGGAEYNINFGPGGVPALYTNGAGETPVPDAPLDYAIGTDGTNLEIALPSALVNGATVVEMFADVNNTADLPSDFSFPGYLLDNSSIFV